METLGLSFTLVMKAFHFFKFPFRDVFVVCGSR